MAEFPFPVPLDNLITYVKALHPDGGPLDNVSDAFVVSAHLDEQSDALIGYFVDQARRSGASWSQIGAAMGVTKQAAQKRFVPGRGGDVFPEGTQNFSRFTDRAARVLIAAGQLAAGQPVDATHLAAALLSEPEGFAAKAIATAGLEPGQVYATLGTGPAPRVQDGVDLVALRSLTFEEPAKVALNGALKAALGLGHNYIGTEHLLLGLLLTDGTVTRAFGGLGLTPQRAEELIADQLAAFQAGRKVN